MHLISVSPCCLCNCVENQYWLYRSRHGHLHRSRHAPVFHLTSPQMCTTGLSMTSRKRLSQSNVRYLSDGRTLPQRKPGHRFFDYTIARSLPSPVLPQCYATACYSHSGFSSFDNTHSHSADCFHRSHNPK